jgi:hypothetical protein
MSITAPDQTVTGLHDPDWHALEDELAPICDQLAAHFASTYDADRRRRDYEARLAEIRRRDAAEQAARAAAEPSPFDF